MVHPANVQDRDGAKAVLAKAAAKFHRLRKIWVDHGYAGQLIAWVQAQWGWVLEVVKHPWERGQAEADGEPAEPVERPPGFHRLPHRWVGERTFAWLGLNRRLSKDYEALPETEESWIYIAMIRLMLRRLARAP